MFKLGQKTLIWGLVLLSAACLTGMLLAAGPNPPTLTSITVVEVYYHLESPSFSAGDIRQYTATGTYSDGSQQYLTTQVSWSSNDTAVATVSNTGLVTGVTAGTATISASLSGIEGSATATVTPMVLTQVAVSPASWTMQVGTTQQYGNTASFGADVIQNVTTSSNWQSSNPSVATVSSTGLVTAVAPGTTTIGAGYSTRQNTTTLTVTSTAPNLGVWSAPQPLQIPAIHMALLYTGKVVGFTYDTGKSGGPTPARLIDPVANTVTDITVPFPEDIFCGGVSVLPNGNLFVTGGLEDGVAPGDDGTYNATIFNPSTSTWTQAAPMNYARWYPTNVPMPDGTVLVLSGTAQDGVTIQSVMESYNYKTNSWAVLPESANIPPPIDDYPLMTVLPTGNVLLSAPRVGNPGSQLYNPSTKSWSFASNLNFYPRAHAGVLILPKSEKVMIAGGGAGTNANPNPTNTTEIIDFSQPNPQWVYGASMASARFNLNLIYLADGTIMAVGGNQLGRYGNPVETPELYNPVTNTWTTLPPQLGQRGYHSTAILLPDGRVFSAGSDSGNPLETSYEFYSPAYLFKGARPTITSAPTSIQYGKQFSIVTPNVKSISRVALIRPGATTHAVHMDDQRYVDLHFVPAGTSITATAPPSPNYAPPGYYMLVIVNANGVPSLMPFVQVQPAGQ